MKKLILLGCSLAALNTVNAQVANAGLEQWHSYTSGSGNLEAPNGWYGSDSLVYVFGILLGASPQQQLFKSTDHNSGSFAARLVTKNIGGQAGVVPGLLTNANINFDLNSLDPNDPLSALSLTGGTAVNQRMGGVKAAVKYVPNGNDTALMFVQAIMNNASTGNTDSLIGTGFSDITSTAGYAPIYAPISYVNNSDVPTSIIIGFVSSAGTGTSDNSTLYVDDVNFVTLSINGVPTASASVQVYPNPAKGVLQLTVEGNESLVWQAYNMQGQKVAFRSFSGKVTVDISSLSAGVYTYRISDNNGKLVQQGKFNVIK
jgi:hypothetical protein